MATGILSWIPSAAEHTKRGLKKLSLLLIFEPKMDSKPFHTNSTNFQVPLEEGKILVVQGDRSKKDLKLVSTMKMRRYLEKDCVEFLARVVDKGEKVRNIQDILIVRNHPEVFLENLPGLPSTRQVEFQD
ncbi:hypothetical protein Tco_0204752 [Tanacetum coccineum]